jgi:hypothetical protein
MLPIALVRTRTSAIGSMRQTPTTCRHIARISEDRFVV